MENGEIKGVRVLTSEIFEEPTKISSILYVSPIGGIFIKTNFCFVCLLPADRDHSNIGRSVPFNSQFTPWLGVVRIYSSGESDLLYYTKHGSALLKIHNSNQVVVLHRGDKSRIMAGEVLYFLDFYMIPFVGDVIVRWDAVKNA